ncbi:MAG: DUF4097 family beta strand repeat-containing protein [Pseudomonadota bacterium]
MNRINCSLIALAIFSANCALAGELIDETRAMEESGIVDIEITNGKVTITTWDRNEFHIAGELSDDAEGFDLRDTGGNIRFEEEREGRSRNQCWRWGDCNRDSGVTLDIQLPKASILRLEGTNVDIDVSGLTANTEIEVINGDIFATDLQGIVKLETVNGSIETSGLNGRIALETVNGRIDDRDSQGSRIEYQAVNGDIRATTSAPRITAENVNGDMELELGAIDELELSTVGGHLEVNTEMNPQAQIDISSVGGSIELTLPASTSARFNINTQVGGRIDNELSDDEPERTNRYVPSHDLNFVLNNGNGGVDISTVTGDIELLSK